MKYFYFKTLTGIEIIESENYEDAFSYFDDNYCEVSKEEVIELTDVENIKFNDVSIIVEIIL